MNPSLDWLKGFLFNPNMAWFFSWFPVDVPPVFGIQGVPPFSHLAIYTLSSLVEQTTPMALRFFDEVASVSEIRRGPPCVARIILLIPYEDLTFVARDSVL